MNRFVRFLCLIFGISVDGGAAQREQWAQRRREMGIEPPENDQAGREAQPTRLQQPGEQVHAERP